MVVYCRQCCALVLVFISWLTPTVVAAAAVAIADCLAALLQRQTVVTAYFTYKRLRLFVFAWHLLLLGDTPPSTRSSVSESSVTMQSQKAVFATCKVSRYAFCLCTQSTERQENRQGRRTADCRYLRNKARWRLAGWHHNNRLATAITPLAVQVRQSGWRCHILRQATHLQTTEATPAVNAWTTAHGNDIAEPSDYHSSPSTACGSLWTLFRLCNILGACYPAIRIVNTDNPASPCQQQKRSVDKYNAVESQPTPCVGPPLARRMAMDDGVCAMFDLYESFIKIRSVSNILLYRILEAYFFYNNLVI